MRFVMRKHILMTAIMLLFCSVAVQSYGQVLSRLNPTKKVPLLPKLYAGVKLGANFSYLSGDTWSEGVKSNLLGGIFAGIKGVGLGGQMEALLEQSEYTTSSSFFGLYKDYYNNLSDSLKGGRFRVSKLTLPVLLQIRMARLIWLQAGVQFYGIVAVKDFDGLVKDSKELFRSGSTAGILGVSVPIGNADIGARAIFDVQNLNNLNAADTWHQYMFQMHIGIKLF